MKKLMTIAAGLLVSTSVFASTVDIDKSEKIVAGTYETKAMAYDAGFDFTESLQAMNERQLSRTLSTWAYSMVDDIEINDSKVTVEEIANSRGEIQYRAIVDVNYQFSAHESN